ncbi:Glucan endo-alpha-glucosidase Agn1 [Lasiodiplodia theobromae]|uniref:Mutanase n=1 Tax=Lasiodiplodia theobromae TaxID=45133 RepID=A0A5N5DDT8_9PEZI|nr:Glucan endo-alpha-glucosidase Agn1 [Lasiodiplodia theobromae]KAB2575988.1 Mutanase [Lasiodiplodia theobromae]KAF4545014.1 Glucan endo-alpha-glucosidase Agn1 [Lasiodiplodia theobromae]
MAAATSVLYFPDAAAAKAVFAHYMVGTTTETHVHTDVDDAAAAGLDGFALNIGDPRQSFVTDTLSYMFDYTASNHPDFHLLFSLDLAAAGGAGATLTDFNALLKQYTSHAAYARGPAPDEYPFVSTFSDGGLTNETWDEWRGSTDAFAEPNAVYLVPDFDGTAGYYDGADGWWDYWGGVVDGLFSWEAAWPERAGLGGAFPGDTGPDEVVSKAAEARGKDYMIGLSPLQYKDAYNTNLYRPGELNLPERMKNILKMNPAPEYAQVITWNDGPESHYIGNLWPEQNTDVDPARYATTSLAPHDGWQPLIGSFAAAFRANASSASAMRPFGSAETVTGALWYKTILQSTTCPLEGNGGVYAKPDGFDKGEDVLNWAVVVGEDAEGWKANLISDGEQIGSVELVAGLNYGKAEGVKAGFQRLEVVDADGKTVRVAAGGRCVSTGCPDCIYNMNPQVVGFSDNESDGECPDPDCSQ